jgi:hypothetical protein
LVTLLPLFLFTLPLLQPAARSFFAAFFTVFPLTLGTMQLETMVALKPSSRLRLVVAVLGAVLSVRGEHRSRRRRLAWRRYFREWSSRKRRPDRCCRPR